MKTNFAQPPTRHNVSLVLVNLFLVPRGSIFFQREVAGKEYAWKRRCMKDMLFFDRFFFEFILTIYSIRLFFAQFLNASNIREICFHWKNQFFVKIIDYSSILCKVYFQFSQG